METHLPQLGEFQRSPIEHTSMNPYASPQTAESDGEITRSYRGSSREHCPICNANINPWQIGNSIVAQRCPDCDSMIWMEYSRVQSMLAMILPVAIVTAWFIFNGWNRLIYPIGICSMLFPILNVYGRILLGHPAAKSPE